MKGVNKGFDRVWVRVKEGRWYGLKKGLDKGCERVLVRAK
jgi:hypothetical protein